MAKTEIHHELKIQLPHTRYPIYIGERFLENGSMFEAQIASSQVLIVTNNTIAPLYLDYLQQTLAHYQCDVVTLKDGELYKNHQSLNVIYQTLIEKKHHRDTTIIALGGGVVGDITGFAAATFQRGVRLIQIPTSLLAQVDSSVGGKTAINHEWAKNIIGSFYHPHAVIMDLCVLDTLPHREMKAGMAEIIKYGLIEGGFFLDDLKAILNQQIQPGDLNQISKKNLAELIAGCCKIKARVVEEDEKESGSRAILNLGHTFGHAIEALTGYQMFRHGEAVAIGLHCAALLSNQLGFMDINGVRLVKNLLVKTGLPVNIPAHLNINSLIELMYSDKKVKKNQLRFILMNHPGSCFIHEGVHHEVIGHVLSQAQF